MPAYDYRCTACGRVIEIVHAIGDRVESPCAACSGTLERLVSLAGYNKGGVGQKPPSDGELVRAGYTKYVRGSKGYEKAVGPEGSPDFVRRED